MDPEQEDQGGDQAPSFDLPESFDTETEAEVEATAEEEVEEGSTETVETDDAVGEEEKDLDPKEAKATDAEDDPVNTFEIGDNLKLKIGQQLTADHLKELQRGYLRVSDYTRKTQEVAQLRNEAQEVLNARDQITQNPQALREYLQDEVILGAYHPGELLQRSLAMNRIPPQLWNQFFNEWREQGGGDGQGQMPPNPQQIPPQVHGVLGTVQKELKSVTSRLDARERAEAEARAKEQTEREVKSLDDEVTSVVSKFPGMSKRELLRELAVADNRLTVMQVARNYYHERQAERQAHIQGKEQVKQKGLKKPSGTARTIAPKAPQTFEEADQALWDMAQAGEL